MKALTILCFKTVCLLGFFSTPAALWAQQVVKGKIIDAIENPYYTLSNTEQGYAAKRVVVTLPPQKFSVYSDGSYSGDLTIRDPNYSMTGLANTLPIGYK
jgi:hypothetical protein